MNKKVFISYSHKDNKIILQYVDKIKELGFEPYYDDDSFYAGEQLNETIHRHIDESFCTIFFLSQYSVISPWCLEEMKYLHNEYETNFQTLNRTKPLRGNIVIRLCDDDIRIFNKKRDNYSFDNQQIIRGFYNIFEKENLDILDCDKKKYQSLKISLDKIYSDIQNETSGINSNIVINESVKKTEKKDIDTFDNQNVEVKKGNNQQQEDVNLDAICRENGKMYFKMGCRFLKGEGVPVNYDEAKRLLMYAVSLDDVDAINKLGEMYFNGNGVNADYNEAFHYFQISAKANNPIGCHNLAICYEKGIGTEQNYSEAIKYYQIASEAGYAKSQCYLGLMYKHGYGVDRDYGTAFKYIKMSADQEYNKGYNNLGILYINGQGIERNKKYGWELIKKAADLGYIPAMDNIGDEYKRNNDYLKAIEYYEKAANNGYIDSCIELGNIYENGKEGVIEKNPRLAFEYFKKAAELEESASDAQRDSRSFRGHYKIGDMYLKGEIVEKDVVMAINNFKYAAENGNAKALTLIGDLYLDGKYIKKNFKEAFKFYKLAIDKGDVEAYKKLGVLYEKGLGVGQDYKKAKECYQKALDENDNTANSYIGNLYEHGLGVEPDFELAKKYYEDANDSEKLAELYINESYENFSYSKAFSICKDKVSNIWKSEIDRLYNGFNSNIDYNQAFKLAKEKAEKNKEYEHKLGKYYYYGHGVKENKNKAYDLWNSYKDKSESMYYLGKLYELGDIVELSVDEALEYYEKSKDTELLSAIELSKINFEGRYSKKNFNKAFDYLYSYKDYISKDTNDNGEADYLLGVYYYNGFGTNTNIKKGIVHFMISACKGYVEADKWMGDYLKEKGDNINAIKFYILAFDRGDIESEKMIKDLVK